MEEDTNIYYEKNEYIYKIIYLIRTNLPSSEYIYIIMLFLKNIGLILFSISLNFWKIVKIEQSNETPKNDNNIFDINTIDNVNIIFSKFLINGNNLKILNKHYQVICIIGFCILLIYIIIFIFGLFYMRNKYYNKDLITGIEKRIKRINNNSIFEKKFFKIITYIFFLIAFFHQYIIEYYLFGFFGYILHFFKVFEAIPEKHLNKSYYVYIEEHFKDISMNSYIIFCINFITIIIILIIFIFFMLINSTKTIFIKNGFPLYANKKYLFIRIIIFNFNPFYGVINTFDNDLRIKITLIVISVFSVIILADIFISFYKFSFYPNILNYFFLFIEFFSIFSIITEIVIYLIDTKVILKEYNLIILVIQMVNTIIFNGLFIYKKNKNNFQLFSENLFSKNYKKINPDDIYYYIETYLKYSKNKESNYLQIFKLIQNHILACDKKDCPGKILVPKSMSYSQFTYFSIIKNETFDNSYKNNVIISNEENTDINNIIFKNLSDSNKNNNILNIEQNNNNAGSYRSNKEIRQNLSFFISAIEKRKSILKRKNTEKIGSITLFSNSSKPSLVNNIRNSNFKDDNNAKGININIDKNNGNASDRDSYINQEKDKLSDEQFIMIGEQEIINRINFLYKRKKYGILEDYIFIHLHYLLKIKQNFRLALYYVGKYSSSDIKFSFLSRYYLYEIRKYICNIFMNMKNSNVIKDPYIVDYKESNIFINKIINYILLYLMLKKLLKIACEKIIFFYTFRTELHNSLSLQKYSKSKIYPVINSAEEIQSSISKLKYLLKENYKEEKLPIESVELCYLISNFIKLIDGKISQDIMKYISPIIYFKDTYYEKLSEEFHHFMIKNPLIINLTKKDTFNIRYFTNAFLDKLGYNYLDLKNKDFHEKLFPGTQELIKEHNLILKEFLFFYKNYYSKTNTFLKSKEGYLISINFTCQAYPSFNHDFLLISNIVFNEDSGNNYSHQSIDNRRTNIFNSIDKMNVYSFLLDYHFDFLSMTKNFFIEYDINQNMFRELRINFCQFFCINENKLIERISKEKKKLFKKNPIFNQKTSLRESNRAFTIFQNIKIENTFKLRDEKLLESYFIPAILIYDKIDKKKLVHKIPEIINLIDEIGLDYDWYIRLKNFKDRLIINGHFQNFKETGISSVTDYNRHGVGDYRRSTLLDQNFFESSNLKNPEQFFEASYSIRKLGSISYYIVNLHEKFYNNEESQGANDGEENIYLNRRSSSANIFSKKFQKLKSQKSINFVPRPSKVMDEINLEEEGITKKAKTKVFFPIISGNMFNNNIKSNESKQIEEKLYKKNSVNMEKTNNDIKSNKNEENKNNEINLIKRNSKQLSNNQKIYGEKATIKRNKIIKKDISEDDESTELIPKDKFNEVLKQLNKKNNILINIVFLLIMICLVILITKFIICMIGFEQSNAILRATIYLEMIKVDIYSQAILSIIYCTNENNITKISNIQNEAKNKNRMTLEHLKLFLDSIYSIVNNKNFKEISNILNQKFSIYNLNLDWSVLPLNVTILEEIRKLSFIAYGLTYNNESCDINSIYEFSKEGEDNYKNKYTNKTNIMQKIFFYFMRNTLSGYRIILNNLIVECGLAIRDTFMEVQTILFYLLICIIILLIIFVIFYIIKACLDYSYYQLLFLYYYHIEKEQLSFENQIYFLYKAIIEFNSENINYFEFSKNNINLNLINEDINKNSSNKNSGGRFNNIRNSLKKKNNKRNSTPNKNNPDFDLKKTFEQNNINGGVLNGSVNGSSLQLLNNSNNNRIPLSRSGMIKNKNAGMSISNEKEEKEESIDSLLKISNKILPNSIKISLIFILVGVIAYILVCCGNLLESRNEKKIWSFSINLSLNILERIPRLMGLLIYSFITVITNNPNKISGSPFKKNQPNYLTYFKMNSLYYSEDIMNKYFKNLYFGELLRDNLRINHNFNNYLYQETNNIFSQTKYWESLLNTGGYFCIYSSIGQLMIDESNFTTYDFLKNVESFSLSCKEQDAGLDESGVKLEINYILQELTNKYIEFITYNDSNITLTEARERFFESKDIRRIFVDMQLPLVYYYNIIIFAVYSDFEYQNNHLIKTQLLFDAFLFIVNLSIIFCLLSVITKGEKYKKLFAYFLEIPKINNK